MKIDSKTNFYTKQELLEEIGTEEESNKIKIARETLFQRVEKIRGDMKGFVQGEIPIDGHLSSTIENEELLDIYDYNNYTINISKLEKYSLEKLNDSFSIKIDDQNNVNMSIQNLKENYLQLNYKIANMHILHMTNIVNELKRNIILNNVKSIFYNIRNLLENYSIYRATTYLENPTDIIIYLLWQRNKEDLLKILKSIFVNGSQEQSIFKDDFFNNYLVERGINLLEDGKAGFYDWAKLIDHYEYALSDRERNVPIGFLIYRAHIGREYEFLCELIHNSHPVSMKKVQSKENIKKSVAISKIVLKKYFDLIYKQLIKK